MSYHIKTLLNLLVGKEWVIISKLY